LRSIEEEWVSYEKKVIPKDAPPFQHQECKRAFYASAIATLAILHEVLNNKNLSDEARAAIIEGLRSECIGFKDQVEDGKA